MLTRRLRRCYGHGQLGGRLFGMGVVDRTRASVHHETLSEWIDNRIMHAPNAAAAIRGSRTRRGWRRVNGPCCPCRRRPRLSMLLLLSSARCLSNPLAEGKGLQQHTPGSVVVEERPSPWRGASPLQPQPEGRPTAVVPCLFVCECEMCIGESVRQKARESIEIGESAG